MPGLGTIINCAAIILGGLCGLLFGRFVKKQLQDALICVCGISVIVIGLAGAIGRINGKELIIIGSLSLGTLVGELCGIERGFERFGEWLKQKTGNAKDGSFVEGFVTASLTVCIGAMAIVGAIADGINGDWSILATKAVLDLVIILVMACSLGKGCIFSAIPVALLQGSVTALARLVRPIMTEAALANLSCIGSILIFCVGLNLVFGKKLRVANILPSILLAIAAAFIF